MPDRKSNTSSNIQNSALLIVDMISCWDFEDADHLLAGAFAISNSIASLKRRCTAEQVPVIYANDNRGRWRSDFLHLVHLAQQIGGKGADIARNLKPEKMDYFILKPKQSAFFGTPLELLLQHLGVTRLIITGVSSDQCVLMTAIEARMRDLDVVCPRDCIASQSDQRNNAVIKQMTEAHRLLTTIGSRVRLVSKQRKQINAVTTVKATD